MQALTNQQLECIMAKPMLTAQRLRDLLHYNPETGIFIRKVGRPGKKAGVGDVAGTIVGKGYVGIRIDGYKYKAHHLAWLYVHGAFPSLLLDHRDTDKKNNRIGNLRETTNAVNSQNRKRANANSKSGFLGVHYCATKKAWIASINLYGHRKTIGRYPSPEDAHAAYLAVKREHHLGCTI